MPRRQSCGLEKGILASQLRANREGERERQYLGKGILASPREGRRASGGTCADDESGGGVSSFRREQREKKKQEKAKKKSKKKKQEESKKREKDAPVHIVGLDGGVQHHKVSLSGQGRVVVDRVRRVYGGLVSEGDTHSALLVSAEG